METIKDKGAIKTIDNTRTILLTCLLALCSLWVAYWLIQVFRYIGQPQMEYSEGFNLLYSRMFVNGQWSWQLPASAPFYTSFYPPVGYYVLGIVTKIFGSTMVVGRLLNLAYFISCVSIIYFIVRHETKDKLVSLIATMLPLTAVTMIAWSMFIRVDMLAILFDLIGVFIFLRNKEISAVFWAIPFFILAFFTKQSMIAGALACTVYLLIHNRRRGILFGLVLAIATGGIFAISTIATQGGFFRALLLYQRTFPSFTTPVTVLEIVIISLALYLPVVVMAGSHWIKNTLSFISIFAASALLINTFTLFHIGGGINYMIESIFGLCMLAGIWLGKADLNKAIGLTITCSIWIFCLLFLALTGMMGTQFPDKEYAVNYYKAVSMIKDADYPILSENAGLVLAAGKVPYYEAFVFQNMAHYSYFNENLLLNDMSDGKVEYVITQYAGGTTGRIDKPIESEITSEYHVILDAATGHAYGFVLYRHN